MCIRAVAPATRACPASRHQSVSLYASFLMTGLKAPAEITPHMTGTATKPTLMLIQLGYVSRWVWCWLPNAGVSKEAFFTPGKIMRRHSCGKSSTTYSVMEPGLDKGLIFSASMWHRGQMNCFVQSGKIKHSCTHTEKFRMCLRQFFRPKTLTVMESHR